MIPGLGCTWTACSSWPGCTYGASAAGLWVSMTQEFTSKGGIALCVPTAGDVRRS